MKHIIMFNASKYTDTYMRIVNRARTRGIVRKDIAGYVEKHHLFPKSLGGSNDIDNLVFVTAKEHFVCHHLLTKMVDGLNRHKMIHAFGFMCKTKHNNVHRKQVATVYANARLQSAVRSPEWRAAISAANKGRKMTPEQNAANSARLMGRKRSASERANVRAAVIRRGVHPNCRKSVIEANTKTWKVTHTDGTVEIIRNITEWCVGKGAQPSAYQTSYLRGIYSKRGPLAGYKVEKISDN